MIPRAPTIRPRFRRAALLKRLEAMLRQRCDAAFLFGSYARNEAVAGSDIDLIIVAPSTRETVERFRDFIDLAIELAPIDLIIYTPEEWRALQRFPNPLVRHARKEWHPLKLTQRTV